MGHMKFIYQMVEDGSYELFKANYETAKKNGIPVFIWGSQKLDTEYAKYVCEYVDIYLQPSYNKHIDNIIDEYENREI